MSYNITAWKIQDLHIVLPLDFDFQRWLRAQPDHDERGYENYGKRWCLEDEDCTIQANLAAKTWKLSLCGKILSGIIEDNSLIAISLSEWTGDFTGHLYSDVLLPLFKEFQGNLHALVVWEGGDSVIQLSINDGTIEETRL